MSYSLYVIQLSDDVKNIGRFKNENPNMDESKPCFYVGYTYKEPEDRFEEHKNGIRSNSYAKKYGLGLRPDLYEDKNPIWSKMQAELDEGYLANELRSKGHGVWSR